MVRWNDSLKSIAKLLSIVLVSGCVSSKPTPKKIEVPPAGFMIEYERTDPNRPVREYNKRYKGPLFDVHAHLDPPQQGTVKEEILQGIADSIAEADVDSVETYLVSYRNDQPHKCTKDFKNISQRDDEF